MTGVLWGHVSTYSPRPPPEDLGNNYTNLKAQRLPGTRITYQLSHPLDWAPWNILTHRWNVLEFFAVAPAVPGSDLAIVVGMGSDGVRDISTQFSSGARQALQSVASGSWQLLVGDDNVAGVGQFQTSPPVLVVDSGTTRVRGVLTLGPPQVGFQSPLGDVPTQSTTTLRVYAAQEGKLYSVEGTDLWSRDVTSTLAGTPISVRASLTGAVPTQVKAIAWNLATKSLYAIDAVENRYLRLLSISTTGTCTELWRIDAGSTTEVLEVFLSVSAFGDLVLSYNLTGDGYEILSFPADGLPIRSASAPGALRKRALSDGSNFTRPVAQTQTVTQANMRLEQWSRATDLVGGVCGATWFRSKVGDQSAMVLGDPSVDCN